MKHSSIIIALLLAPLAALDAADILPSVDLRRDIVLATEVFGEARGFLVAIM